MLNKCIAFEVNKNCTNYFLIVLEYNSNYCRLKMSYRSKRTRVPMTKDDELQTAKKLTSPETMSSSKTPGASDERWGPFGPPVDLTSCCTSHKDPSTCTSELPHMKSHILQQTRSGQNTSTQKALNQKIEMPHYSASKVDESKVFRVTKSCPIWKNTPPESSSKQKESLPGHPPSSKHKESLLGHPPSSNKKQTLPGYPPSSTQKQTLSRHPLKLHITSSTTASLGSLTHPPRSSNPSGPGSS